MASSIRAKLAWLQPVLALGVLGIAGYVLHHELAQFRLHEVLGHLREIPGVVIAEALALTFLSYWLLSGYDVLGLRYARKSVPYPRAMFTAFIAYAFGHNLTLAGITGAAVRLRLYSASGLSAVDVATVSGFCSLTSILGIAALAGTSLLIAAPVSAAAFGVPHGMVLALGGGLLATVGAYVVWAAVTRKPLEIRGWALHAPGGKMATAQILLGITDFTLAAAVLWVLLPQDAAVGFPEFAAVYAACVAIGLVSAVPGGIGVFEAAIVLSLPQIEPDALLGSLLAYRAVYYLAPLALGALLLVGAEVRAQHARIARVRTVALAFLRPIVPQIAAGVALVAGAVLLLSGATPSVDQRLAALRDFLIPLPVVEVSHLIGSFAGLGLVVLAAALRKRVTAAYHLALALAAAGIVASLLKGLDIEEAVLLAIVAAVLIAGRREFYRQASLFAEPLARVSVASIAGIVAATVWVSLLAYRNVDYSHSLWWTFAFDAGAPRTMRAALIVSVAGATLLLVNLLRPARPEPANAGSEELARALPAIARSEQTLANAALTGDKRLLFATDDAAFIMYQIAGRSWVALGDPIGDPRHFEDLVWQFREISDRHDGWTVFYHASGERLAQYVDLGLAAFKLGEEARVPLAEFSLEGSGRADLRQDHRRAVRDGASFSVTPAAAFDTVVHELEPISTAWLAEKATAEKRFSIGSFEPSYLRNFDTAIVRRNGRAVAFANIWATSTKRELSIDLMRFDRDAPRGAMDFLFVELMLWGKAQGYQWFNLGMAPLAGLEQHPLAPAWHRVGNFVFRHGEHFFNFEGLRQYKSKFHPVWEPRYLVAPGGIALPRILVDVSTLISGGFKGLLTK
jgi:phosphatidylglycerol lysyltransferase